MAVLCAAVVRNPPSLQVPGNEAICRERFGQDYFPGQGKPDWRALVSLKSWLVSLCSGLTLAVYVSLTLYYTTFLGSVFSTSPSSAGWVVLVSGVLSASFCIVSGVIADKFGNFLPAIVGALIGTGSKSQFSSLLFF